MILYTATGRLDPVPPFAFAHTLDLVARFVPLCDEAVVTSESMTLAMCIGGQPVAVRLTGMGTIDEPLLRYRLYSTHPLGEYATTAATARLSFFLSLNDDLGFFYELGLEDAHFSAAIRRLYGYHQVKFPTPFEAVCWALVAQHAAPQRARAIHRGLVRACGGRFRLHDLGLYTFPSPQRLAEIDEVQVLAVVGDPDATRALQRASAEFAAIDQLDLRDGPRDDVTAWLRSIGLDAHMAEFVMNRGLGRTEHIDEHDADLGHSVTHAYGRPLHGTPDAVRRIADRYGPWQGYWADYLLTLATRNGSGRPEAFTRADDAGVRADTLARPA